MHWLRALKEQQQQYDKMDSSTMTPLPLQQYIKNVTNTLFSYINVYPYRQHIYTDDPLYILGNKITNNNNINISIQQTITFIVWLTYRDGFPSILNRSKSILYTSDRGWGCMQRTAQMLQAQTLIRHLNIKNKELLDIIAYIFGDDIDRPFSIHKFIKIGEKIYNKNPGEWYGPWESSILLSYLLKETKYLNDINLLKNINKNLYIYIVEYSIIYIDALLDICCKENSKINEFLDIIKLKINTDDEVVQWDIVCKYFPETHPIQIIAPLQLGAKTIDPKYHIPLLRIFQISQLVGILSGTPSSSLFLIGYQNNQILFLDPHYTQPSYHNESINNLHKYISVTLDRIYSVHISCLDASLALGFYCSNYKEILHFFLQILSLRQSQEVALLDIALLRPSYMLSITSSTTTQTSLVDDFIDLGEYIDNCC